MTQNTSAAVMQRRVEPHDSLDDFPTPPWATRALFDHLVNRLWWPYVDGMSCREPAANRGHMVRPLREIFGRVEASDIHDYGAGFPVQDYLFGPPPPRTDWTVTNPPFRLAEQFVARALECSDHAAVIVRSAFLEGVGRHKSLFSVHRPRLVLQFTERVVMHKGTLSAKGSTATAYCWILWSGNHRGGTEFDWIAPCRKRLERADDYAAEAGRS
jgi:hypothetical protein